MVCTCKYLHDNQNVTYLIHKFSLRASCYRIPNLAAAQSSVAPWPADGHGDSDRDPGHSKGSRYY